MCKAGLIVALVTAVAGSVNASPQSAFLSFTPRSWSEAMKRFLFSMTMAAPFFLKNLLLFRA